MPGYEVVRAAVPRERVDAALRLLHGDMLSRGIDANELGEWLWGMHWFPHLRIVGIALSDWTTENGGLIVQAEHGIEPVELAAGDAVMMTPDLPHSGGVNHTGAIRYGVYFRFL